MSENQLDRASQKINQLDIGKAKLVTHNQINPKNTHQLSMILISGNFGEARLEACP